MGAIAGTVGGITDGATIILLTKEVVDPAGVGGLGAVLTGKDAFDDGGTGAAITALGYFWTCSAGTLRPAQAENNQKQLVIVAVKNKILNCIHNTTKTTNRSPGEKTYLHSRLHEFQKKTDKTC
jgi:hypothetical protein